LNLNSINVWFIAQNGLFENNFHLLVTKTDISTSI